MKTNYIEASKKYLPWLKENLDEERYEHSVGCAMCAFEMAKKFDLDPERAYIAGLLHDCAKCFSYEKMVEIGRKINLEESEICNNKILHAPISAYVAEIEHKIDDDEILSAIRWHTLGRVGMSEFEKIIFLADKIEPNTRCSLYSAKVLKLLEEENGLDKALLICYQETIKSLVDRKLKICKNTIDIYNSFLD